MSVRVLFVESHFIHFIMILNLYYWSVKFRYLILQSIS